MIAIEDLCLHQGAFRLEHVHLCVPTGRYGVLMGKTGSGKTSVLESVCGLRYPESGRIQLGDLDVTRLPPGSRGVGYVPQDGALFPTKTVHEHLAFSLTLRNWPRTAADHRVHELADWLGIAHLLDRYPAKLSGGEAQRVALGRALAHRPTTLLLDEPLSALDDDTRDDMYALLDRVRESGTVTVLHVTHNRGEADRLGDVKLRLHDGKVIEEPAE